jgi:excisionase family DNA binding protein
VQAMAGTRTRERDLLSVREVLRRLNIGRSTLYRLFDAGELPSVKVAGRRHVQPADLADYIQRHRTMGRASDQRET